MQDTAIEGVLCKKEGKIVETVQTGLFVHWQKSVKLIRIVQNLLRTQCKVEARSGPCQLNDTCELVLRALNPSGANFADAKNLLETYLKMIDESRPDPITKKEPEVIDLASDEEEENDAPEIVSIETVGENITIIDLDESANFSAQDISWVRNTEEVVATILEKDNGKIIIDLVDDENTSSNANSGIVLERQKLPDIVRLDLSDRVDQETMWDLKNDGKSNCPVQVNNDDDCKYITTVNPCENKPNVSESSTETAKKSEENSIPVEETSEQSSEVKNILDKDQTSVEASASTLKRKKTSIMTYKRLRHITDSSGSKAKKAKTDCVEESAASETKKKKKDSFSNIYNPKGNNQKRTGLRPIIIDGNNVAVRSGNVVGKGVFCIEGIQLCIEYFEKRGHKQIKAFVPHYRLNRDNFETMTKLEKDGKVVLTPSRRVNGKLLACYDDRYIVQYASEVGGVIVSRDNYRDLWEENPDWKETIENRLLMFTFVDGVLMFPNDPMGRTGPSLDDFLKFPD